MVFQFIYLFIYFLRASFPKHTSWDIVNMRGLSKWLHQELCKYLHWSKENGGKYHSFIPNDF